MWSCQLPEYVYITISRSLVAKRLLTPRATMHHCGSWVLYKGTLLKHYRLGQQEGLAGKGSCIQA